MPSSDPGARGPGAAVGVLRYPRGLAHPVVVIFLAAALFSYLSGDPVRAGYLLVIGLALAWDRSRARPYQPPGD